MSKLTYYKATKADGTVATRGSTRNDITHAVVRGGDRHGSSGATWHSRLDLAQKELARGHRLSELVEPVKITGQEFHKLKLLAR